MTQSPNKATLIQKIKNLEGLTQDERAVLIDLVNTKKKYGLVWEDKPEEVEEQLRENLPVLREVVEKRIIGADLPADEPESTAAETQLSLMPEDENEEKTNNTPKPAPNHILIEGDNLHALTALTFTHEGKIDVIYIDPPYNTGNKDFKYNDSFVDREDSYRHSKWLSFMHKRLVIAKRLLSDNGVIFISIDDNELAQLKILGDEVFGEQNFIEYFSWNKTSTPPGLSKKTRKTVEYILCYEKQKNGQKYQGEMITGGDAPLLNSGNKRRDVLFPADSVYFKIHNQKIAAGIIDRVELKTPIEIINGRANRDFILNGEFKWTQNTVNKEISLGTYFLVKSNKFSIRFQRKNIDTFKSPTNQIKESIISPTISKKDQGVDTNEQAHSELINILGKPFLDYPKPKTLIKYLVKFFPSKEIKVLDFFAGSGTTLHACMELNEEDMGERECIMVNNNENNICEEVTYERNKRVIEGYTNSKGEFVKGLKNNNLRYYKSEFVGRERTVNNKIKITRLATELLCIKEDIYDEVSQLGSFALNAKEVRAFAKDNLYLMVIYTESIIEEMAGLIEKIVEQTEGEKPHFRIYVFSNGQYPYNEEFEDVAAYVTLCALPDAIYKAYQHILPSRTPRQVPTLEEPGTEEVEDAIDNQPNLFNQPPN